MLVQWGCSRADKAGLPGFLEASDAGRPLYESLGFVAEKDFEGHYKDVPLGEGIVPDDNDEFIDPRLANYPIPEVAKTVDLRNDPT